VYIIFAISTGRSKSADATASRPPDLRYSKLHFILESAKMKKSLYKYLLFSAWLLVLALPFLLSNITTNCSSNTSKKYEWVLKFDKEIRPQLVLGQTSLNEFLKYWLPVAKGEIKAGSVNPFAAERSPSTTPPTKKARQLPAECDQGEGEAATPAYQMDTPRQSSAAQITIPFEHTESQCTSSSIYILLLDFANEKLVDIHGPYQCSSHLQAVPFTDSDIGDMADPCFRKARCKPIEHRWMWNLESFGEKINGTLGLFSWGVLWLGLAWLTVKPDPITGQRSVWKLILRTTIPAAIVGFVLYWGIIWMFLSDMPKTD
jgi:hypothetical protein